MSVFDENLAETPLCIRDVYDIYIVGFDPRLFYSWIWKEKRVDYPPRYEFEYVPMQLLYDILIDKLSEISVADFIKWEKEFFSKNSIKYFRRYFGKLIKRKYMPTTTIEYFEKNIQVHIPFKGDYNTNQRMIITFRGK